METRKIHDRKNTGDQPLDITALLIRFLFIVFACCALYAIYDRLLAG